MADSLLTFHANPQDVSPEAVQCALQVLGADPEDALPVLEQRGDAMVLALQAAGPDATPVLALYVHSAKTNLVRRAFYALKSVGTPAGLPAYAQAITNQDAAVRSSAVLALRRAGPAALQPALTACHDPKPTIRMQAYFTVGMLGEAARAGVPELSERLENDPFNRKVILRVLSQVGGEAAVDPLLKVLLNGTPSEQQRAAQALARMDPPARRAIPGLVETLAQTNEPPVAKAVVETLTQLAVEHPADIESYRNHANPRIRQVIEKLAPLEPQP
jgi:HEAT repeat protein